MSRERRRRRALRDCGRCRRRHGGDGGGWCYSWCPDARGGGSRGGGCARGRGGLGLAHVRQEEAGAVADCWLVVWIDW